jgi:Ca-activated chloride channel family protein
MLKLSLLWLCLLTTLAYANESIQLPEYLLNRNVKKSFEAAEYKKAQESITELLEKDSSNARYLHNLGQTQLLQKQPKEAQASFEKALALLPEDKKIHTQLNLAASYLMQKQVDPAIAMYQSLLKEDPSNVIAKHNLELALEMKAEQQNQEQQQNQQQDNQSQQQPSQQQQGSESETNDSQEENDPGASNEESQDSKNSDQSDSSQSDLEKELEDARKKQEQKENEKKQNAYDILDTLSQREKDARKKHLEKQQNQQGINVEYDW